jgi:hypothetical protein
MSYAESHYIVHKTFSTYYGGSKGQIGKQKYGLHLNLSLILILLFCFSGGNCTLHGMQLLVTRGAVGVRSPGDLETEVNECSRK